MGSILDSLLGLIKRQATEKVVSQSGISENKNTEKTSIKNEIELLLDHDYARLLEDKEFGIIRTNCLEILQDDPWNKTALTRISELSSGQERAVYQLDILRIQPMNGRVFEDLLLWESQLFLGKDSGGLDILVVRLDRIFSRIGEEKFSEHFKIIESSIDRAYKKDPYKARSYALAIIKSVSKLNPTFGIMVFKSLRNNLVDERIQKTIYSNSKKIGRFLVSLSVVEHILDEEQREFERMNVLVEIAETIFQGEVKEVKNLISDLPGKSHAERFSRCLIELAPHSRKISDFLLVFSPERRDKIETIIEATRLEFSQDFEDDNLFDGMTSDIGDLIEDLANLPLYSIRSRLEFEMSQSSDLSLSINRVKDFLSGKKISQTRRNEILVSLLGSLRMTNPNLCIDIFEDLNLENEGDERILRQGARAYEARGDVEKSIEILKDAVQRSSASLLERLTQLHEWIKNGYNLEMEGEVVDDFRPTPGKIMYCVHAMRPFVNSGYTIRTEYVTRELQNKGFEVGVFSRWGFPVDRTDYKEQQVESNKFVFGGVTHIIDPDYGGNVSNKNQEYVHLAAKSLLRSALIFRPSVMYSASDHSIGLAASMVADVLEIPFVYEMRGLWAYSRAANNPDFEDSAKFNLMMTLEKQCAEKADSLLVISESLKEVVTQWGIAEEKIDLLPNGIDPPLDNQYEIESLEENTLTIGYIGALVPYEGLNILVDSIEEINKRRGEKSVKCLIAGDGSSREYIEEYVNTKNMQDQFDFLGRVPHEEIEDVYSRVDVVVVPRLPERVCEIVPALKPLDAMKHGKLVICSDIAPSKSLIEEGENGFLFDKGSHISLADVLDSILLNRDLLLIGKRSAEWASENRPWPKMVDKAAKNCVRLMLPKIFDSATPNTKMAIKLIGILMDGQDLGAEYSQVEFEKSIQILSKPRDRKNSFLAFLRELGEISPREGLIFGKKNLDLYFDRRSVRSLITYANRSGDNKYSEELVYRFADILDDDFTKSQEASIEARKKRNQEKRKQLTQTPTWYSFDIRDENKETRFEINGNCYIEIGDIVKSSLCRFEFIDKDGLTIETPPKFLYKSKSVGYYSYLAPEDNQFCITFGPPPGTEVVRVGFQLWETGARVSIHPDVEIRIASLEEINTRFEAFIDGARNSYGSDVVFMFSGTTYINDVRANRPIRLTRVMLERGNRVIFNYHRSTPREDIPESDNDQLIQIPIDVTTEMLGEICEADYGKCRKVLIISYPHPSIPKVLYRFKKNGWRVIYDARDDWEEFALVGQAKWYKGWSEKYIVRNSDKSSAVSWPLAEKLSQYGNEPVTVIPNALSPNFRSPDFKKINSEVIKIGYFGHLTDSWFDWPALISIAKQMGEMKFEIIGHSAPSSLELPENVSLLGPKNHPEINKLAASWRVGIIPFKTGPLADAVDPIKIYEYLALGLPTVSFSMPQIDDYPITKTVETVHEFKDALIWAIDLDYDMGEVEGWLKENTWEKRVDSFESWYSE